MPLKIDLGPGERVVINGAVIKNGPRRAALILQNRAQVLLEKNILTEDHVDTPTKRIYFSVQLMYLDEEHYRDYLPEFNRRTSELVAALSTPEIIDKLYKVVDLVATKEFYKALVLLRDVLEFEHKLLHPEEAAEAPASPPAKAARSDRPARPKSQKTPPR